MKLSKPLIAELERYEAYLPKIKTRNGKPILEESGISLNKTGKKIVDLIPEGTSSVGFLVNPNDFNCAILTHHHPLPYPLSGDDISTAIKFNLSEIRSVDPMLKRIYLMESPHGVGFFKKLRIFYICKKYEKKIDQLKHEYGLITEKGTLSFDGVLRAPKDYWKKTFKCYRDRNKAIHNVNNKIKFRTLPLKSKGNDTNEDSSLQLSFINKLINDFVKQYPE